MHAVAQCRQQGCFSDIAFRSTAGIGPAHTKVRPRTAHVTAEIIPVLDIIFITFYTYAPPLTRGISYVSIGNIEAYELVCQFEMASQNTSSLPLSALHRLLRPKMQQNASWGLRYYSAPLDGTVPVAKQKYIPTTGTYPKGFMVSGTYVGVKTTNKSTPDLAFLVSESPCSAAAVFTKNKFQAAPVTVSRDTLKRRGNCGIRAIIVNSGCANAVTGRGGLEDAEKMGAEADRCFNPPTDGKGGTSLVMSTGVIGQRLVVP
jgi:hypothetical protein